LRLKSDCRADADWRSLGVELSEDSFRRRFQLETFVETLPSTDKDVTAKIVPSRTLV
jgi:hypothetical protein